MIVKFNGKSLDRSIVSALFDMRLAVEGIAMRRLAERHTERDIIELRDIINAIVVEAEPEEIDYMQLAIKLYEFHHSICVKSKSAMLPLIMNAVRKISIDFWENYILMNGIEKTAIMLSSFVDFLEQGDGDAAYRQLEKGLNDQMAKLIILE